MPLLTLNALSLHQSTCTSASASAFAPQHRPSHTWSLHFKCPRHCKSPKMLNSTPEHTPTAIMTDSYLQHISLTPEVNEGGTKVSWRGQHDRAKRLQLLLGSRVRAITGMLSSATISVLLAAASVPRVIVLLDHSQTRYALRVLSAPEDHQHTGCCALPKPMTSSSELSRKQ